MDAQDRIAIKLACQIWNARYRSVYDANESNFLQFYRAQDIYRCQKCHPLYGVHSILERHLGYLDREHIHPVWGVMFASDVDFAKHVARAWKVSKP